jgi:protein SCO1/2
MYARLIALVMIVATCSAAQAALKAGAFDPPRAAPEFSLKGSDGAELNLRRFRGKVVVIEFGYTSCPNVCPAILSVLRTATRGLGDKAQDVQILYITVDPERDDAARLKSYLSAFDETFIGGTGTAQQLAEVRQAYGVQANKVEGAAGAIAHTSFTYLIDRSGRLRGMMPFGRSAEDYVHDLRLLLAE